MGYLLYNEGVNCCVLHFGRSLTYSVLSFKILVKRAFFGILTALLNATVCVTFTRIYSKLWAVEQVNSAEANGTYDLIRMFLKYSYSYSYILTVFFLKIVSNV